MQPYFIDTETMGLCGPITLIQYCLGADGDIVLYEPWKKPVGDTLGLIETFMLNDDGYVGFNVAFDHFHLCKLYTMFKLLEEKYGSGYVPDDFSTPKLIELLEIEDNARFYPMTLRPKNVCDLMAFIQKGPYQHCMNRDPIRIRRVPESAAHTLAEVLNDYIKMDPILFAKQAKHDKNWSVLQAKDRRKNVIEGFNDVVCTFHPSLQMKTIVQDLGFVEEAKKYKDVGVPNDHMPMELGFAPYAKAFYNIETLEEWTFVKNFLARRVKGKASLSKLDELFFGTWLNELAWHVNFWTKNKAAREYAYDDVVYTRKLWLHYSPEMSDDDSVLTACVAAVRWRGFSVDLKKLEEYKQLNEEKIAIYPNHSKRTFVLPYLTEKMTDEEKEKLGSSTDKQTLIKLANKLGSEVGKRANIIKLAREAKKELELIYKLKIAGRFHAAFNVIGTLSSRMSGSSGLNPQGIKKQDYVRACFPLADADTVLCGGDFSAFEVSIIDAVSDDPRLKEELDADKKIHATFGTFFFSPMSYDEILASEGTADDKYTKSKSGLFALFYGGNEDTLMRRIGVTKEAAIEGIERFLTNFTGVKKHRDEMKQKYSPLVETASGGYTWVGAQEYVQSLLGFKRFFSVEFGIQQQLHKLAINLPRVIQELPGVVLRSKIKGEQTVSGATMSALYGAAFGIQGDVFRQAGNHEIQATGGEITKRLERKLWENQPVGAAEWVVQPLNIHDEIMAVVSPNKVAEISKTVETVVEDLKQVVPRLKLKWKTELNSWADK